MWEAAPTKGVAGDDRPGFARFDQSPGKKVRIGGSVSKEYWGEGSSRARNWQRYDQGEDKLHFEEGVDGYLG
ncbi:MULTISPECIES: IMP dehydrogenase [Saccharothrix]|uniref:IMP dehydrogenase n=1 Tax=Saccharothrix TaxID=2071 RepID=UPI0009607874|nr:IMP dehydrogenase [Saccharothrix sp. CB00851]OKI25214.1 hypothetical protein A6A25_33025 [Saccharothrix sp. CB00851]